MTHLRAENPLVNRDLICVGCGNNLVGQPMLIDSHTHFLVAQCDGCQTYLNAGDPPSPNRLLFHQLRTFACYPLFILLLCINLSPAFCASLVMFDFVDRLPYASQKISWDALQNRIFDACMITVIAAGVSNIFCAFAIPYRKNMASIRHHALLMFVGMGLTTLVFFIIESYYYSQGSKGSPMANRFYDSDFVSSGILMIAIVISAMLAIVITQFTTRPVLRNLVGHLPYFITAKFEFLWLSDGLTPPAPIEDHH